MLTKNLQEIREMSRAELEAFMNDINSARPENELTLPFAVLAALHNTTEEFKLPISNNVFGIMLNYLSIHSRYGSLRVFHTFWLEHDNIKGCCCFTMDSAIQVLFLTASQTVLLKKIEEFIEYPPDNFAHSMSEIMENNPLPMEPLTAEELADPLISAFHINPNSGSIDVAEHTSRFSGATWFEEIQKKTIILAGLGGIGSYTCFLLSRMQPTAIFLYDNDLVEAVNMSGQLYGIGDVGEYKVDAIASMVEKYANYNSVFAIRERFAYDSEASDIMICGFDNMEARKTFFDKWVQHVANKPEEERSHCLFIDGRLSAEYFQVYCLTGNDGLALSDYSSKCLFSDEDADETVCSYKQTTYMANMIGSIIVNLFTNFVANEVAGAPIRELPYLTTYDGNSMQFKIE